MTLGQKTERIAKIINELIDCKVSLALADAIASISVLRGRTYDRIDQLNTELANLLLTL